MLKRFIACVVLYYYLIIRDVMTMMMCLTNRHKSSEICRCIQCKASCSKYYQYATKRIPAQVTSKQKRFKNIRLVMIATNVNNIQTNGKNKFDPDPDSFLISIDTHTTVLMSNNQNGFIDKMHATSVIQSHWSKWFVAN